MSSDSICLFWSLPVKRSLVRLAFCLVVFSSLLSLAQDIAPNENLVAEGVPKIPKAIAESVERYNNYRTATFTSWNPVRREMLISTRFADVPEIHLVKMPAGARSQLTFYSDPVRSAQYEPTKGESFIFSKDVGGGEFFQIYRYDVGAGQTTLLTDGKSRNTGPVWSHDGQHLAYGSTRRTANDVDLYVIDPQNPQSDHMLTKLEGGGWEVLDWSHDGRSIAVLEEISANESYLWIVDATSGEKKLLTPKGGPEKISYAGGQFGPDDKTIYTTTDKESEFHRLARLDLASGKADYLTTAIPWDVESFDMSDDGKKLAFVSNEDGFGVLHIYDVTSKVEHPAGNLPQGIVVEPRFRRHTEELAFEFVSARTTTDVYSLDVPTGKLERWTFSELGGLSPHDLPEPELVHWKSWDGRMISGFLYRPPGKFTGPRPMIINIHGGPEGQFRPGFLGALNYYLDELGVALFFPNVRGSTGYGKTYLALDNGVLRDGSYRDINTLLDWASQQPEIDAKRVLITGGSYGGFMTLAVATNYNDRIRCSVDIVGPSNLVTFLEHTSGYRKDLRRVEYGDERDPKVREYLESIAPANHAQNITKPLFVIAGKNDPRVPYSESLQMVEMVRKNNTPVWFLGANDEGHGFQKKKNRDFQFYATVMFVKEFLLK
jgi:dipeptidyl aminopeptidase/acylaminoacyl peptidase